MVDIDKIRLIDILTIKGSIDTPESFETNSVSYYNFDYSVITSSNINEKRMFIEITMNIIGVMENDTPSGVSASYTNRFAFEIENLEDYVIKVGKDRNYFDKEIGNVITSVAYSTMRGIIHTRTQGTPLNGIIIPVVDVNKLTEGDTVDKVPDEERIDLINKSEQPTGTV